MSAFEFDEHEHWEPFFHNWMQEIAPVSVMDAAKRPQEYREDALELFLDAIGKDALTDYLAEKLAQHSVKVFHGTRVSDSVLNRIRTEGLKPLDLSSRRETLTTELQDHPKWSAQEQRLDDILHKYGPGWERAGAGKREDGGVHACLSRAGLLKGSNHYLTLGAEVDNHITRDLFSDHSGFPYLIRSRTPLLISFDLKFPDAERAANPYGATYERLPFITEKFFSAWAFRMSDPAWSPAEAQDSIALRVNGIVGPDRLTIERVTDAELERS